MMLLKDFLTGLSFLILFWCAFTALRLWLQKLVDRKRLGVSKVRKKPAQSETQFVTERYQNFINEMKPLDKRKHGKLIRAAEAIYRVMIAFSATYIAFRKRDYACPSIFLDDHNMEMPRVVFHIKMNDSAYALIVGYVRMTDDLIFSLMKDGNEETEGMVYHYEDLPRLTIDLINFIQVTLNKDQ